MMPNSLKYIAFLSLAAVSHALMPNRGRNLLLLAASWLFYLLSMPKYLPLMIVVMMLLTVPAMAEELTGRGQGFRGVVTVVVTKEGNDIISVVADAPNDTPSIAGPAIEKLVADIAAADFITVAYSGVSALDFAVEQLLGKAGVAYEKLIADDNKDLCIKYGVKGAPTLVITDGENHVNYYSVPEIKKYLASL